MNSLLAEHGQGSVLTQADLDWFGGQGVRPLALARTAWNGFSAIRSDRVVFHRDRRFEFERYARLPRSSHGEASLRAYIFLGFDLFGDPADLVAWHPDTGGLASWRGLVSLLGEEQAFAPRLQEAIAVHADPIAWLRENRSGLVIVHPGRARSLLLDAGPLKTATIRQGSALRALLRQVRCPTILVPAPERANP